MISFISGKDEENLLAGAESGEEAAHGLGLDPLQREAVHDHSSCPEGGLGGQGGLDSKAFTFLLSVIAVI